MVVPMTEMGGRWCRLLMEKETKGNRNLALSLLDARVADARTEDGLVEVLGA